VLVLSLGAIMHLLHRFRGVASVRKGTLVPWLRDPKFVFRATAVALCKFLAHG
jgi:hypothetical protein